MGDAIGAKAVIYGKYLSLNPLGRLWFTALGSGPAEQWLTRQGSFGWEKWQ